MTKNLKTIYVLLVVLLLVFIGGFYLIFQKISNMENVLGENASQNGSSSTTTLPLAGTSTVLNEPSSSVTGTEPATSSPSSPLTVNSSILFNATSSSDLSPQTNLTILINKMSESPDGNIAVSVKVFTDSASSYSAVDIGSLIQIFSSSGSNIEANNIVGAFKAMPPQGSVDGILNFSVTPGTQSVVFQVGSQDNPSFYEFDFPSGTYKQVTVG